MAVHVITLTEAEKTGLPCWHWHTVRAVGRRLHVADAPRWWRLEPPGACQLAATKRPANGPEAQPWLFDRGLVGEGGCGDNVPFLLADINLDVLRPVAWHASRHGHAQLVP